MKKISCLTILFFAYNFLSHAQDVPLLKVHFIEGEKEVFFYGSAHDNNISNPMFADIEESFHNFMPDIVLIEGGYNNRHFNSKEEAIESGEMAFVSFLASSAEIPRFNIEPSDTFVDSVLHAHFSSSLIFTMYILRQTFQYQSHSINKDIDFVREIEHYAKVIAGNCWFNINNPVSFEEIYSIVENETGILITKENWQDKMVEVRRYLYNRRNPVKNPVQIVHTKAVDIRDEYAISLIMNKLDDNNKVFVIMGNQHLINQEQRLREAIKSRFLN
jgi:hypothetical protein